MINYWCASMSHNQEQTRLRVYGVGSLIHFLLLFLLTISVYEYSGVGCQMVS
jgi:hypothetical protein